MENNLQRLLRVTLLLALMLVFQSLRLLMPLPVFISLFVIGSLVNACLLFAAEYGRLRSALLLAIIAPVAAYMQQQIPLPILIIPIVAANTAYLAAYCLVAYYNRWAGIIVAAAAKAAILYVTVTGLVSFIAVPGHIAALAGMMFGWPQVITGLGGGMMYIAVRKRLHVSGAGT